MPQSAGAMSSPSANLNKGTPKRFVSHPPANRRLDFSVDKTQQSPPKVPQKSTMSTLKPFKQPGSGRKGRKKGGPFDLSATDDEDAGEVDSANETGLINGGDDYTLGGGEEALVDYTEDQENAQDQTIQSIEEEEHFHNPDIDDDDGADATSGAKVPEKKKRGKPPGRKIEANPDESTVSLSTSGPSRRGRPPKKAKSNGVEAQGSEQMMGPPKGKGKRKKSPSEEQNVRKKVAKTVARAPSVRAGSVGARAGNIVQRAETPATDTGALVTRSGRHSFKPLASWRGEKAILGRRTDADSLPAITDIIRTEEVMGPPKGRAAYRRARPRAAPKLEDVEEEEDDMDEWERENGILQAPVMLWDSENGKYMETETEEAGRLRISIGFDEERTDSLVEIAFAAGAIEMRDIAGATFKFAKTLTLPFFGSGMVHLPPRGEKRVKNSRKMQMVFFVFYGRVTVTVGSPATPFSIGKGGQWQVPRGKPFSFHACQSFAPRAKMGRSICDSFQTICQASLAVCLTLSGFFE